MTRVFVVHDESYLYLAAECQKHPEIDYAPTRRPRPRDANLRNFDRIDVRIDINRDYTSSWHIEIDHRGWTAESVFGDRGWNPTYFVASRADDTHWTIEVAIPLDELGPEPYRKGTHWAVEVRRLIPEYGLQSQVHSAGLASAAGINGLMLIE